MGRMILRFRGPLALMVTFAFLGCGGPDPEYVELVSLLEESPLFESYDLRINVEQPVGVHRSLDIHGDSEGRQGPLGEWAWQVQLDADGEPGRFLQANAQDEQLHVRLGSDEEGGFPDPPDEVDFLERLPQTSQLTRPFDFGAPLDRAVIDPRRWVATGDTTAEPTAIGTRYRAPIDAARLLNDIARLFSLDGVRLVLRPASGDEKVTVNVAKRGRVQAVNATVSIQDGGQVEIEALVAPSGLRAFRTGGPHRGEPFSGLPPNATFAVPPRLRDVVHIRR
jgi:hypothetical protein